MSDIKQSPTTMHERTAKDRLATVASILVQCSRTITPLYSPGYPKMLARAVRLRSRHGYSLRDAMQLGLLNPDFPESEFCRYISKRNMLRLQKRLNPAQWTDAAEDKGIFYTRCILSGIPIPRLFAIYFHRTAGISTGGNHLTSKMEWENYINANLPSEFVIKPTNGVYGKGFKSFQRTMDGDFLDIYSRERYGSVDIYNMMWEAGGDFVIQERLKSHPDIMQLSGTENLQTIRFWTYVDRYGEIHILLAFLKIIVGNNITDNQSHGLSGNLCAGIDLDKGTLMPAVRFVADMPGIVTVNFHPVTDLPIEGFQVPLWKDLCSLARRAASAFLPLRIVGWDIAVTPHGPVIIEGNANADPPNHQKKMDRMLAVVYEDLEAAGGTVERGDSP